MRKMRAQRSHARAPTHIDNLPLRRLQMKIAERSNPGNTIARLQTEDIARSDTRQALLARRRGRDAHVEPQRVFCLSIACEGVVVALAPLAVVRNQVEHMLALPHTRVGLRDVKVAK